MKNDLSMGPVVIHSEFAEGAWTDEEARHLLQAAYAPTPPDPAVIGRVERRVLEYASEGPLRRQRLRLVSLLVLLLTAYMMMLLGCAWLGQQWGAPLQQEWYVASPSVPQAGR